MPPAEVAIDDPGQGSPPVFAEVADAASLEEGEAGVRQVLRAIGELAPATTRSVSRQTGLPSPVVAAVSNELRARGLVTRDRPSRLTPLGQELLGEAPLGLRAGVTCGCCHGDGLAPGPLAGLAGQLAALADQAPAAELALDQSHCTADTKLRRVLFLLRTGLLPARAMICVGDDDLMGVTVAMAETVLHRPLVQRLAVLDVSAAVIGYARQQLKALGTTAELVEHDLREPLPVALRGGFDLALTDPPYTVGGGRLFLSRAVEALRPGPGHAVAFSFGPKGPAGTLRIQDAIRELGLTVQAMHRDFNSYLGAGVIGGHSHLYHLASTSETAPAVAGAYAGPMYTADARQRDRVYRCMQCGARHVAGPGAQWQTIAELKTAGCPACGGHRLRPLHLAPPS